MLFISLFVWMCLFFKPLYVSNAGISGERIWMELRKIVCGRFNGPIMQTMLKLGLGPYMGKHITLD